MATTNLLKHPAFKDGAFTSDDRAVRRAAIGKAMRGIDLGAELGAGIYVSGAAARASRRALPKILSRRWTATRGGRSGSYAEEFLQRRVQIR
jgi:hypothetical protein